MGTQKYNTACATAGFGFVDTLHLLCYNRSTMTFQSSDPSTGTKADFPQISVFGITGVPEINTGDNLAEMIVQSAERQGTPIQSGDVLVVTQKVVSKAEDRVVDLKTVTPSEFALKVAAETERDPRLIELVLQESRAIVRMDPARGIMITETRHGFVCANAGIDTSNVPGDDMVCLLPVDPDHSARAIREQIVEHHPGMELGVIISDTFGRAWREGHANFAIGVAGMDPFIDYRGTADAHGQILKVTTIAVADELAATSELVTAKAIGVPAAIIRGYKFAPGTDGANVLVRDPSNDLFR